MYSDLCLFGDVIPLSMRCDAKKLLNEVKDFNRMQYNPRKDIKRNGLSITSLDGELNGIDLDSITEYNSQNNTSYNEMSFTQFTDVYFSSEEIKKIVQPFKDYIGRTHIIELDIGGFFPPHRDWPVYSQNQQSLRILIPLKNCNPPDMYFTYDENTLFFEHGRAYFINTNKMHSLFSFSGSSFIVCNVKACEEVYTIIGRYFRHR